MALFEVPTSVVADTRGRRASFLLSEATLAVGTLAYVGVAAIDGGLLLFYLAGVILGLGYTFYSGLFRRGGGLGGGRAQGDGVGRPRSPNERADRITAEAPETAVVVAAAATPGEVSLGE